MMVIMASDYGRDCGGEGSGGDNGGDEDGVIVEMIVVWVIIVLEGVIAVEITAKVMSW